MDLSALTEFPDLYFCRNDRAHSFTAFDTAYRFGKRVAKRFGFALRIKTTGLNKKDGIIYKYVCCQRQGQPDSVAASSKCRPMEVAVATEAVAQVTEAGQQPQPPPPPLLRRRKRDSVRCDCRWGCKLIGVKTSAPSSLPMMPSTASGGRGGDAGGGDAAVAFRYPVLRDTDTDLIWFWDRPEREYAHNHPVGNHGDGDGDGDGDHHQHPVNNDQHLVDVAMTVEEQVVEMEQVSSPSSSLASLASSSSSYLSSSSASSTFTSSTTSTSSTARARSKRHASCATNQTAAVTTEAAVTAAPLPTPLALALSLAEHHAAYRSTADRTNSTNSTGPTVFSPTLPVSMSYLVAAGALWTTDCDGDNGDGDDDKGKDRPEDTQSRILSSSTSSLPPPRKRHRGGSGSGSGRGSSPSPPLHRPPAPPLSSMTMTTMMTTMMMTTMGPVLDVDGMEQLLQAATHLERRTGA